MLNITLPIRGFIALRNALGEERATAIGQALELAQVRGEAQLAADILAASEARLQRSRAETAANLRRAQAEWDAKLEKNRAESDARLERSLNELDTRLQEKMMELDTRLQGKMTELDTRLQGQVAELDTRLQKNLAELDARQRKSLEKSEARLQKSLTDLDARLQKSVEASETRWHQTQEEFQRIRRDMRAEFALMPNREELKRFATHADLAELCSHVLRLYKRMTVGFLAMGALQLSSNAPLLLEWGARVVGYALK